MVQMILYWVKQLDAKKKIDPLNIYAVGTEVMADVMVMVYSIYAKLADLFVNLATRPTKRQFQLFTLDYLIRAFRK